jgi:hypothetical protein
MLSKVEVYIAPPCAVLSLRNFPLGKITFNG